MNVLRADKRAQVERLLAAGETVREVARRTGVNRETVNRYRGAQPRMKKLIGKVWDWLEQEGIDAMEIPGFQELHLLIVARCTKHPDAKPFVDVDPKRGCRMCKADGLKRHHARRKAAGTPIFPPWAKEFGR